MTLDEAIAELKAQIVSVAPGAAIKVAVISNEEARISVDVAAGEMQAVTDSVRDRSLQIMINEGYDVQVQVYDKDVPKGEMV